jgi:hypothetical protein
MTQTKLGSLIEALFNVVIGYTINFAANFLILPLVGFHISASQSLAIGIPFTVISVARSYVVRRWFNAYLHRAATRLSQGFTNAN